MRRATARGRGAGPAPWLALAAALLVPPAARAAGPATAVVAAPAAALDPERFERAHGLRILGLHVLAAGGLVDLRLRVTDERKARALLERAAHGPRIDAAGRSLAAPHAQAHQLRARQDAVSYLLFPNVGGAVRPGARVTVAFGDVKVTPVTVR